jgi:phosphoglucosamine mutase
MANLQLFGTDGIRGRVGEYPFLPDFILRLGLAIGATLGRAGAHPNIVIGRDTRSSGQMLQNALQAGLLSSGATVIDAGVITTPGVAFLARKLDATAGIVISASHNPARENGIKLFNAQGLKLPEAVEAEIEGLALTEGKAAAAPAGGRYGRCVDGGGMRELYMLDLVDEHRQMRMDGLTIVMDCANGAASWIAPECFARLDAQIIAIHASPTGLNINAACGSEQIRRRPDNLSKLVRQYNADFGLAFDGDADRVIFVDEEGNVVDGDHMLGILAHYFAGKGRLLANTVVATNMRNAGLVNFLRAGGFDYAETKVGDKYVVDRLLQIAGESAAPDAIGLGGEQAGHVILLDSQHNTGDGIRTALYLIQALLESGSARLADLAGSVQKVPQVIASAVVSAKPPLDRIAGWEALKTDVRGRLPGLQRMELRYSGTELQFRAMLEADAHHTGPELAQAAWDLCRHVQDASRTTEGRIEVLDCARGGLLGPLR